MLSIGSLGKQDLVEKSCKVERLLSSLGEFVIILKKQLHTGLLQDSLDNA